MPARPTRSPTPGPEDFRQLRQGGYYYVDKTHFIAEWLRSPDQVVLLPRPRRFGKTLNLLTLKYWIERSDEDHRPLFEGLSISAAEPEILAHQGRYPVIFVSFKDVKESDFAAALKRMQDLIRRLYREHRALLDSPRLDAVGRSMFAAFYEGTADSAVLPSALRWLSDLLIMHHGVPVVILIDEYDAPIEAGFAHGYLDPIVSLMRGLLGTALKTNPSLHRAVITGVRRVSRESLFSDLNNVRVRSMMEPSYDTCFGFTEPEVATVLAAAGRAEALADVRAWYDGYRFGAQVIYNPWSVLCFAEGGQLRDHWVATSADGLLRRLLLQGDGLESDFATLLDGGSVEKCVDESISLRDLELDPGRVWAILLTAGYLKADNVRYESGETVATLTIPNLEVRHVWRRSFAAWLHQRVGSEARVRQLHRALLDGQARDVQRLLQPLVLDALSYHDTGAGSDQQPERVYHAFVLGLLVTLAPDYRVVSNRESGLGRADVLLVPRQPGAPGVVLEFKRVWDDEGETAEQALTDAHQQIVARRYRAELENVGATPIHALAVVFTGKKVWVS